MSTDINKTLEDRGNRYGDFAGHAQITMDLKTIIHQALLGRDKGLEVDQMEALHMICHKIGRIINGDANYADSWIDIAGYAQLVSNRLESENAKSTTAKLGDTLEVKGIDRSLNAIWNNLSVEAEKGLDSL